MNATYDCQTSTRLPWFRKLLQEVHTRILRDHLTLEQPHEKGDQLEIGKGEGGCVLINEDSIQHGTHSTNGGQDSPISTRMRRLITHDRGSTTTTR